MLSNWKDSLHTVKNDTSLSDSIRLEALYQLCVRELNIGLGILDEPLVAEFNKMAHKYDINRYKALSINLAGMILSEKAQLDSSIIYYEKALEYARKANDSIAIMKIQLNLARNLGTKGKLLKAMDILNTCEKNIAKGIGKDERYNQLQQLYNTYLFVFYAIDDWENAIIYAKKSVELDSQENSEVHLGNLYNLGMFLTLNGQYDEAIDQFNRALNQAYSMENVDFLKAMNLIGLAKVYGYREELDIANQYIKRANEILEDIPLTFQKASLLVDLLEYYQEHGYNEKSYQLASRLHEFADFGKSASYKEKISEVLYNHYRSIGEFKEAFYFVDRYHDAVEELNKSDAEKEVLRKTLESDFEKRALRDSLHQIKERADLQTKHERQIYNKQRTQYISLGIGALILLIAIGLFSRMRTIRRLNKRTDELLLNILPQNVAHQLKETGTTEAKYIEVATILFTDFVGFTELSERIRAAELLEELNYYFSAFDKIIESHGIEKIKTIGDAYMAAGGVPKPVSGSVKNTVLAALEMQKVVKERTKYNLENGFESLEMRVGIHSGPVVAGVVGLSKFQYDIWGDTVNIAARMETAGVPGKVNISQSTYTVIKEDAQFNFEHRGKIAVKGKEDIEMYFVSKL